MIRGCAISEYLTEVYACKYGYDENGIVSWPMVAINYATKTQFLFRINKGIHNIWNNEAVNQFTPENLRPVPFRRMIFLGDGETDIPCLKMVHHQGGYAIAVYDPKPNEADLRKISDLLRNDRANFVAPADYTENSQLDIIVRGLIGRMRRKSGTEA